MNTDTQSKPFAVLVAGTNLARLQEAEAEFDRSARFRARITTPATVGDVGGGENVDVVLLCIEHLDDTVRTLLEQIRTALGEVPVVVLSDQLEDTEARELIHLHVDDWLVRPLKTGELVSSIEAVMRSSKTSGNKVHAVISGSAGAGATVTAVSLTGLLASKFSGKGKSVSLFDLDFASGNCGYALNMVNRYDLKAVLSYPERVDVEFTNLIREQHKDGFFVYSFKRPELTSNHNSNELVLRMLDAVNFQHEHTVLDIPYYSTDWRANVLEAVDTYTIVADLNLPALRQTLDVLNAIREIKGDSAKVTILINKHRRSIFGGGLGKKDLKELFGDTPIRYLPYDDQLINESLNRGVLPAEISSGSKFVRALRKYSEEIVKEKQE